VRAPAADERDDKGMPKKDYRKPSYPAALRMARIAFELPSHPFGWALDSIREELDISERTLKRYLAAGQRALVDAAGRSYFEVVSDSGKPRIRLPAYRKPVESTAHQAVSLYFTLTILKFLEGTILQEGVEDLWEKFLKGLFAQERGDLRTINQKFYAIPYAPKDYRHLNYLLAPIIQGLLREYRLRIEYGSGLVHEVDPYALVAYRGGLYLIGKTHLNNQITTMAVERMRAAELKTVDGRFQKFPYPLSFRPERHMEGAFGIIAGEEPAEIKILIHSKETEGYLRARSIHPTQRFSTGRDGKTVLTMTVRGTTELRNWVLGFGPWLEVLEPKALRDEIAALLKEASRNYRS
jgi:predicted DNA-binding transcriptional regulator YafY